MRTQRFVDTIASTICEGIATPRALGVHLRLKYGCYDEIARMSVHPHEYTNAADYHADSMVVNLLRKDASLPGTVDRKAAALANFWKAERECFKTNLRLAPYLEGFSHPENDTRISDFIRVIRKYVRSILGDEPPASVLEGRFGPGSTYGDTGLYTTLPDKMQSRPTITNSATPFLLDWTFTAWGKTCAAQNRDEVIVAGNRFTTVPKDCLKDRGIAIEPSINLFYQLGVGSTMKDLLARRGINLRWASDKHRQVACEASKERLLATIDLSNASDTVSKALVKLLLPKQWFTLLDSLRSPTTLVEGKVYHLEKFSSMGNGFTFELESIIFTAISAAAMEYAGIDPDPGKNLHVFGDDIIVPCTCVDEVISALTFLGFTLNKEKSFVSGSFKESCGADFYDGVDVRPYFIKEAVLEPQHYIKVANGLRALREKTLVDAHRSALQKAWFKCLDQLPSHIRALRGPAELGDLLIHDEPDRWSCRINNSGIREFRVYKPVLTGHVEWKHFTSEVVLASALYLAGSRGDSTDDLGRIGVLPRDSEKSFKVGWVSFS